MNCLSYRPLSYIFGNGSSIPKIQGRPGLPYDGASQTLLTWRSFSNFIKLLLYPKGSVKFRRGGTHLIVKLDAWVSLKISWQVLQKLPLMVHKMHLKIPDAAEEPLFVQWYITEKNTGLEQYGKFVKTTILKGLIRLL